ncbi:hypothetical protein V8G54_023219 [Vigna mungo]|uniref:Uncharacterized protein n=1 Tax=Vigna mungo TaxID=3915 RepID=A0AAQ3N510_VIGMU
MHINIGVEAGCFKLDFWRLKRVIIGKRERQLILCAFKHSIFASTDCSFPEKYVVLFGKCRYPRISTHLTQITHKTKQQSDIFPTLKSPNYMCVCVFSLPSKPSIQIAACLTTQNKKKH